MARYTPPPVSDPRTAAEKQKALEQLATIPGDTFAVKTELKALGAVWDPQGQTWRIAPDKLILARALVESQALAPKPSSAQAGGEPPPLSDPFEEDVQPTLVPLVKQDGDTYAAREALRVIGARWDGNRRNWIIREEKAEYARAVIAYVTTGGAVREAEGASAVEQAPEESPRPSLAVRQEVTAPQRSRPPGTPAVESPVSVGQPGEDRIKLGGLWTNHTRDGREYLTGRLSPTVSILIFPNDSRTGDDQPTHVMYLAPVEPHSAPGDEDDPFDE